MMIEIPTAESVAVAFFAGVVLGLVVLGYLVSLPTYASEATPGEVFAIIFAAGSLAGAVFYIGQAMVDPVGLERVSRFGVWAVYSAGMASGTWLRLVFDDRRRRRRIHSAAAETVAREVADRHPADVGSGETDRR